MKLTIEPANEITTLDGRSCRVWRGVTNKGVPCHVFIAAIAVPEQEQQAEFERELQEVGPPKEVALIDVLRHLP